MSLLFTIRQYLYWLFLLSSIIPIFQSLLFTALIMTNTMTCAMKREAWIWYLPSHLVPAKILCSRCEPCTKKISPIAPSVGLDAASRELWRLLMNEIFSSKRRLTTEDCLPIILIWTKLGIEQPYVKGMQICWRNIISSLDTFS